MPRILSSTFHFPEIMLNIFSLRVLLPLSVAGVIAQPCAAQAPPIQWQRCLGGSNIEEGYSVVRTTDGGYVALGKAGSSDGDVATNNGQGDVWLVKVDAAGTLLWEHTYGGSIPDEGRCVRNTMDGGYVIAGIAWSSDGDVSEALGSYDYWVVKVDGDGELEWERSLGGSGADYGYGIEQTTDGGYIVVGWGGSVDGMMIGEHGGAECWVVRLDPNGQMLWQKPLGGSANDFGFSVTQTNDGNFVVAGYTLSTDGDITDPLGGEDAWAVKLDDAGEIIWQSTFGGSANDQFASVLATTDGGVLLAGSTRSTDGDVSSNHGSADFWVVKLDAMGVLEWERTYGGSSPDTGFGVSHSGDGGYLVCGDSWSDDGDLTEHHPPAQDYWVFKIDAGGELLWQRSMGGSGTDRAHSVAPTDGNGCVVAGWTVSFDGEVTGYHDDGDLWMVRLQELPTSVERTTAAPGLVVTQQGAGGLLVHAGPDAGMQLLTVVDGTGRVLQRRSLSGGAPLVVQGLAPGLYHLHLSNGAVARAVVSW